MRPDHRPDNAGTADALPVLLRLLGVHAEEVRRWVTGVVGWQEVSDEATGVLPPRLVVADVAAGAASAGASGGPPRVLVVGSGDGPVEAARAGRLADAVVAWPAGRGELGAIGERAAADLATRTVKELRVAGAAGGVGTTTVALALAALAAWGGDDVLYLGRDRTLVHASRSLPSADLAGAGTWAAASPVPGVPRLRALRVAGGAGEHVGVDAGPAALVVRDLGVDPEPDVLVVRRDAAGLDALERSAAAVSVVVDAGPASPRSVVAAAGRRRVVVVPWSARVARAGLARRVPAGLPASWLGRLRGLVPSGAAS